MNADAADKFFGLPTNAHACLGLLDSRVLASCVPAVLTAVVTIAGFYFIARLGTNAYIDAYILGKETKTPVAAVNAKANAKAKAVAAETASPDCGILHDMDVVLPEDAHISNKFGLLDGPYKMVLCVNQSLKMEKGKIAAQCGHATLACYRKSMKQCPDAVAWWERMGQAKIALKIPTDSDMDDLQAKARALGLVTYIVEDAGRTQIAAGSRTVLGIGPAPVSVIDSIASHLKLL